MNTNDTPATVRGSDSSEGLGGDAPDHEGRECPRCHGDGMDPWCDYLFSCPECGGRDAP